MSSEDFESALCYLKQLQLSTTPSDSIINNNNNNNNTIINNSSPYPSSLYDHLTSLIVKLTTEQTSLTSLENASIQLKKAAQTPAIYKELPSDSKSTTMDALHSSLSSSILASADRALTALSSTVSSYETEIEGPSVVPDLLLLWDLLERGGISIKSKEDAYLLWLEMKDLVKKYQLKSIRFFGKINGIRSDYLIIEAEENDEIKKNLTAIITEKEKNELRLELPGKGINEFIYFVKNDNNNVSNNWIRLPDLLPEHIQAARGMRRYFSGNLSSPVLGYPSFRWPEAYYLRAQIARIAASTIISPVGYYLIENEGDDDEKLIKDDEYQGLSAGDLLIAENWAHHRRYILRAGRTTVYEEPEREEDDEEEDDDDMDINNNNNEEEEEDLPIRLLSTCDSDRSPPLSNLWIFRAVPKLSFPHPIIIARSSLWPGSMTVVRGTLFTNIYCGDGHKYLGGLMYTPPPPPAILSEYISKYNADDDEIDPIIEQNDPLPPEELPEEKGDGDDGEEGEERDDDEEENDDQEEPEDE